nr:transporter substrate-binding domain-containing protein [Fibrobacter sp. UWB10]
MANKKVGVLVGTTGEIYAADYGTDSTRLHAEKFETLSQAVDALLEGSIDAVLTDDAPAKVFARKNPSLRILNEVFKEESYAGVVAKENMGLLDSVNIALIQMRAMGVYDSIFDAYIGGQSKYHVKTDSVTGPVLRVATNAEFPPFEFRCKKRGIVGIDIEIARYVANYLGRNLEIIDMDFDDIIDSVKAGKADLGLAAFSVTEERGQIVNFTDHYATSKIVIMVRSGEEESTFQRIKDTLLGG